MQEFHGLLGVKKPAVKKKIFAAFFCAAFFSFTEGKTAYFSMRDDSVMRLYRKVNTRNVNSDKRGMRMIFKIDLLDALSIQLDCAYLSDLHHLNDWQRTRLIRA